MSAAPSLCAPSAILALLSLGPLGSMECRAEATTIFVDGIDAKVSLWDTYRPAPGMLSLFYPFLNNRNVAGPAAYRVTNYVENSWLGGALRDDVGGTMRSILWNGDMSDTRNIDAAIADTESAILVGTRAGNTVNLVTHSMGTVIGYLALQRLAVRADAVAMRYAGIQNFITLSSPLGVNSDLVQLQRIGSNHALGLPGSAANLSSKSALRINGVWLNVYADNDVIGATAIPADGVQNSSIRGCPVVNVAGIAMVCAHSTPLLHYQTIRTIIGMLRTSPASAVSLSSLTGRWAAAGYCCYNDPSSREEIIRITDASGRLEAIKERGDPCVNGGELTFYSAHHFACWV